MVVYLYTQRCAELLAQYLHRNYQSAFVPGTPGLTCYRYPGIALGAEPRQIPLGFGTEKKPGTEPQSFGTIRAQLLASAVCDFTVYHRDRKLMEKRDFYHGADALVRMAAIAFEGYRNDLMPGSN